MCGVSSGASQAVRIPLPQPASRPPAGLEGGNRRRLDVQNSQIRVSNFDGSGYPVCRSIHDRTTWKETLVGAVYAIAGFPAVFAGFPGELDAYVKTFTK
jgi:hypothetical protein